MSFTKEAIEILWTKDYDDFEFYDKNRQIDFKHADKKIQKSLIEQGLLKSHPMIVDGSLRIRDGQHRFIIAKQLGIEIPVLVVDDFDDSRMIAINNASKKWAVVYYIRYRSTGGDKNAQKLISVVEKYNVSIGTVMRAANLGKPKNDDYITMPIRDFSRFEVENKIDKIMEIAEETGLHLERMYHGIIPIIEHKKYDHKRMIKKIVSQKDRIYKCNSIDSFKKMFEDVYNYKQSDKIYF